MRWEEVHRFCLCWHFVFCDDSHFTLVFGSILCMVVVVGQSMACVWRFSCSKSSRLSAWQADMACLNKAVGAPRLLKSADLTTVEGLESIFFLRIPGEHLYLE